MNCDGEIRIKKNAQTQKIQRQTHTEMSKKLNMKKIIGIHEIAKTHTKGNVKEMNCDEKKIIRIQENVQTTTNRNVKEVNCEDENN